MTALPSPRETRLKLAAEARAGKPLAEALPELLNVRGWRATAEYLGVSAGTLNYWLLQYGIKHRYVAIPKGYQLLLVPDDLKVADEFRVPETA